MAEHFSSCCLMMEHRMQTIFSSQSQHANPVLKPLPGWSHFRLGCGMGRVIGCPLFQDMPYILTFCPGLISICPTFQDRRGMPVSWGAAPITPGGITQGGGERSVEGAGRKADQDQEGGGFSGSGVHPIPAPFIGSIHLHESTWPWASDITGTGLTRSTRLAGAYLRAREQMFLTFVPSRSQNCPVGCSRRLVGTTALPHKELG